jgi:hypothetical protein
MTIEAQHAATRYGIEEQPLPSRRQRLCTLGCPLEIECRGHRPDDRGENPLATLLFAADPSFITFGHSALPLDVPGRII